ncbi:MAG: hypothetical protein JO366_16205 [Methylobacteriaceae bacterium]|nr:hypothetical protein [Methylobacteriaceae bacterium]
MSVSTFTLVHVVLSLVGILTGIIVLIGALAGETLKGWTGLFLATTILTSVTGFFLPATGFQPSHAVGILSLVILAIALVALYGNRLAGAWRWIYAISAVAALYLNAFVGVVQAFQKLPFLQPLAPTQSEPPFLIAQIVVLAVFVVLGILAAIRLRPVAPV